MSVASITAQLNAVIGEIAAHNTARALVVAVKTSCQAEVGTWEGNYSTLAGDDTLMNVRKDDVFEGEMAEGMKSRVADIMNDINISLTRARNIETALGSQVTRLDNEITRLESQRQSLQVALEFALHSLV